MSSLSQVQMALALPGLQDLLTFVFGRQACKLPMISGLLAVVLFEVLHCCSRTHATGCYTLKIFLQLTMVISIAAMCRPLS